MLLPLPLLALCSALAVTARVHYALAEDLYAFPKYRVAFLNGLPLKNITAEHWLKEGLHGGERQFLDQQWHNNAQDRKQISSGVNTPLPSDPFDSSSDPEDDNTPSLTLQRMNLVGKNPYLCLIPPPIHGDAPLDDDLNFDDVVPWRSWNLLQPLSGSCLYHRQGWFTYSYCHNHQVRQFRELAHSHPHPPGGLIPEEDPEWEAYTLGQSAIASPEGNEISKIEQAALANNVDIERGAGHRYLVQKWGDGTICDKTNQPREIEVQFHCSMAMTDTILFVKETKTCHYVMVIHTPRLCSEPGFKTRLEQRKEAVIQCREIVDDEEIPAVEGVENQSEEKKGLVKADSRPFARPSHAPVIAPPKFDPQHLQATDKPQAGESKSSSDVLRKALEALLASNSLHEMAGGAGAGGAGAGRREGGAGAGGVGGNPNIQVLPGGEGEFWVEFIDAEAGLEDFQERVEDFLKNANGKLQRIEEALRAAGHDINQPLPPSGRSGNEAEEEDEEGQERTQRGRRHGQEL